MAGGAGARKRNWLGHNRQLVHHHVLVDACLWRHHVIRPLPSLVPPRWQQAFRWWWGRLVFVPLRAALAKALPPPLPDGAHRGDMQKQHHQPDEPERVRRRGRARRGNSAPGDAAHGGTGPRGPGPVTRWLSRHRAVLLLAVPTLGVFAFSAAFHELLLWINFGAPTGEGVGERVWGSLDAWSEVAKGVADGGCGKDGIACIAVTLWRSVKQCTSLAWSTKRLLTLL